MKELLQSLEKQVGSGRNYQSPPLHLWHPPLSGNIPILISKQGVWYHEGGTIERKSLVCLFASILRREEDGEYYLVTPVEKWRIQVERHPLLIVDIDQEDPDGNPVLDAILSTGARFEINDTHPLFLDPELGNIAAMRLPHGLTALCSRAAWYRLVGLADTNGSGSIVKSGDYLFNLSGD